MGFLAIISDTIRQSFAQVVVLLMLGLAALTIVLSGLTWDLREDGGEVVLTLFGIEQGAQRFSFFEDAVLAVRALYVYMWVVFGSLMFIFAAAFLTTRKLVRGVAELYLSAPLSRGSILAARGIGIFLIYLIPCLLSVVGVWLVTGIETGIYGLNFIYLLAFFGLFGLTITGLAVGLGTVGGNPSVPIVVLSLIWVTVAFVFPFMQKDEVMPRSPVAATVAEEDGLDEEYYAREVAGLPVLLRLAVAAQRYMFPPLGDLTACATALQYPGGRVLTWRPVYVGFGQAVFGFLLAALWFIRRDY